jgi:response regulator RpfG family c-di-GMP phosphodiesterase
MLGHFSKKILSKYNMLSDILPIIRSHHEAFDGSGYPEGLKGNEIPIGAKIIGSASRIID